MPIAVVRAEKFYMPPPREPANSWDQVPAAERVFKWIEYRMERRVLPPAGSVDQTYFARINQNRWIADCICGSAQVVSPSDPRYGCTECGWGWCALIFPADAAAVEAPLMSLPPYLRNWWHADDPRNPNAPIVGIVR
ncbi:hypothetical protein [Streptomyces sp. H27-C3]|uniref:hypothetical protein n=1 Tax=Streptomyces sp. H27-C3 TaxID=3046305 RepID=UPI0024B957D0|nr:hypothetical protein [Streptomyces sp. H27-C3]MDJ0461549.1 hypothetical protein [Streptomyces sp. H27-C3]